MLRKLTLHLIKIAENWTLLEIIATSIFEVHGALLIPIIRYVYIMKSTSTVAIFSPLSVFDLHKKVFTVCYSLLYHYIYISKCYLIKLL